jgi:plastocyanin
MLRLAALPLAALLISTAAPMAAAEDATEICKEASLRYKEMTGRDAASEPVRTVLMYKYKFCPENVTVKRGEKLRYFNVDKRTSHSVWLKDAGQEESERVFSEGVIDVDTNLPKGEHDILCGPHWQIGMRGKVIIGD